MITIRTYCTPILGLGWGKFKICHETLPGDVSHQTGVTETSPRDVSHETSPGDVSHQTGVTETSPRDVSHETSPGDVSHQTGVTETSPGDVKCYREKNCKYLDKIKKC